MNVRGNEYLNFTPEEAAPWLDRAEVRQYAPRHAHPADNDNAIAGVFGVVALGVILTIIGVGIFGSNLLRQSESNASGTSVQSNNAVTTETSPAYIPRQEVTSENVPSPTATLEYIPASPTATSESSPAPVAYLPAGWFYGRMRGTLPLRNKEARSMGAVEDGSLFFATTAESAAQIIVAEDGSYWGFSEITLPENLPTAPIPITPAFENAAHIISRLQAFGITEALYLYNRQTPEEAYLPAGWSMGDLAQDQPLTDGVNGARVGTLKRGTRLLFRIANVNDWRLVVSSDGSSFGYACIRSSSGMPQRSPMRPECRGGVALIHRLEQGSGIQRPGGMRQALAENSPAPTTYGGEEQ
jgi:hypothetical protein